MEEWDTMGQQAFSKPSRNDWNHRENQSAPTRLAKRVRALDFHDDSNHFQRFKV